MKQAEFFHKMSRDDRTWNQLIEINYSKDEGVKYKLRKTMVDNAQFPAFEQTSEQDSFRSPSIGSQRQDSIRQTSASPEDKRPKS